MYPPVRPRLFWRRNVQPKAPECSINTRRPSLSEGHSWDEQCLQWYETDVLLALFSRLHSGCHGLRAVDQCGRLARIQLAVEAQTYNSGVLPSHDRRTSE